MSLAGPQDMGPSEEALLLENKLGQVGIYLDRDIYPYIWNGLRLGAGQVAVWGRVCLVLGYSLKLGQGLLHLHFCFLFFGLFESMVLSEQCWKVAVIFMCKA